jgi:DNA topoisomerase-3
MAILMIAEKPAIAQAFAAALAPQQKYQKQNRGSLPTFSFTGLWAGGNSRGPPGLAATSSCEYHITSTIGHVYNVDFPNVMRNWQRFDPEDLFDAAPQKKEASPDAELPQHLADEASRCHAVVLCLDCDREGEAIAYEALESVLPNLAKHPEIGDVQEAEGHSFAGRSFDEDPRVWRAKFSSLAPNDLRIAMKSLAKPNALESRSVDARAEIDLKVGIALSRLITLNLKDDVGALAPTREGESGKWGALLSYGPCQTPTLGFCVDRWDQIQNFNKQVSHTLDLRVRAPNGSVVTLSWVPSRELLSTQPQKKGKGRGKGGGFHEAGSNRKDLLDQFVQRIQSSSEMEVECESVEETEGIVERPAALNTVEMLRLASRELGIDPQRAMAVAEKLYLAGITTYPRTETTQYPSSINVKEMLVDHAEHKNWGSWCRYLLQGNINEPKEAYDAGDHPPITPVWCASEELTYTRV